VSHRLEYLGGPWDGRVDVVPASGELRIVALLPGPSVARPRRVVHVYRLATVECDEGCCSELVMHYVGCEG